MQGGFRRPCSERAKRFVVRVNFDRCVSVDLKSRFILRHKLVVKRHRSSGSKLNNSLDWLLGHLILEISGHKNIGHYSVFGIRLFGRIVKTEYSVFGIRWNLLFGASLIWTSVPGPG